MQILIIEDDRDIVELVRYNLTSEGFEVTAAGDGLLGLAQLRKAPPDLLLLDLMLPKMTGLEICKEIRRDPARCAMHCIRRWCGSGAWPSPYGTVRAARP